MGSHPDGLDAAAAARLDNVALSQSIATPEVGNLRAVTNDAKGVICSLVKIESTRTHAVVQSGDIKSRRRPPNLGLRILVLEKPSSLQGLRWARYERDNTL